MDDHFTDESSIDGEVQHLQMSSIHPVKLKRQVNITFFHMSCLFCYLHSNFES